MGFDLGRSVSEHRGWLSPCAGDSATFPTTPGRNPSGWQWFSSQAVRRYFGLDDLELDTTCNEAWDVPRTHRHSETSHVFRSQPGEKNLVHFRCSFIFSFSFQCRERQNKFDSEKCILNFYKSVGSVKCPIVDAQKANSSVSSLFTNIARPIIFQK